ncbi:MAG: integrin alpha, partial [Actinomycetota bacterium]|nr:integrin alpha [Actinomycetota bacterium]
MISVGAALVLCGAVVPLTSPEGAGVAVAAQGAAIPFDFDGDGYADLAVGVPGEDLRGKLNAGAVQVLYGSASGPTAHDQLWHQGRKGVKGAVEAGDFFGSALTSG